MRLTFFQFFTISVFSLFIGVVLFVAIVSFSRDSKASLLSIAKVNQIRFEETVSQ